MFGVDIKIDGFLHAVDEFCRGLEQVSSEGVSAGLQAAESGALSAIRAQTTRRTGDLEDKLTTVKLSSTKGMLFDTSDHAHFIDAGTGPHRIVARNARFLRFEMNGQTMFRTSVNHPGTKPRPFVALAMAAGQIAMRETMQTGTDRLARAF